MGLLNNLFSNKSSKSSDNDDLLTSTENGSLSEAAQMANVVTVGLENQDFSNMNQQLMSIASVEETKLEYVFNRPAIVKTVVSIILCVVATLSFLYCLFISGSTAVFSKEYFLLGIIGIIISSLLIIFNISLIVKLISSLKFNIRFASYCEVLEIKRLVFIDDLTSYSKLSESTVIKDLKKSIKHKLIPQGHFSREENVFMVSDNIYNRYLEKPAVYDRYFQKQLDERMRTESRTKRLNEIMELGEQYIKKLNDFKVLIKDKAIAKKVEKLVNIVTMVFREIDVNPSHAQTLGVFLNYYLPTTEKLLDTYVSITEDKSSEQHLIATKKEIEEALNTIIISYDGVLAKLYEQYEMDISSEIDALEIVMKKENSNIQ